MRKSNNMYDIRFALIFPCLMPPLPSGVSVEKKKKVIPSVRVHARLTLLAPILSHAKKVLLFHSLIAP